MKILYGVQGTGNGHITRARAIHKHFAHFGIEADLLFSGRAKNAYFDMANFGDQVHFYDGLTFCHEAGEVKVLKTLRQNSIKQFWRDVKSLDLSRYDAVMTDFEPISAWAGKRQNIPVIGVGHQYAFDYNVPRAGDTFASRKIMQYFSPTDYSLGLHWHHFNNPILPPIAEIHGEQDAVDPRKILVYFGFEDQEEILEFLSPFKSHTFVVYGRFERYQSLGHIQLKPLSRDGFCRDLASSAGVISNAGFELASESIQMGKKLLVKPLKGQMEQLSNAKALEELNLGMSMPKLDSHTLEHWLEHFEGRRIVYPDVAKAIVEWIAQGDWSTSSDLADALWEKTAFGVEANSQNANRKSTTDTRKIELSAA